MSTRSLAERLALSELQDFALGEPLPPTAHPKVARIVDVWRSLSPGPGLLPGRRHFDPALVPELLPNLWLIDVVPADPRLFRFRLIGGAIVDAGARFRKGEFLADIGTAEEVALLFANCTGQMASRRAQWRRGPSTLGHLEHIPRLERVTLPMAADGTTVDLFLCLTVFYHADGHVL